MHALHIFFEIRLRFDDGVDGFELLEQCAHDEVVVLSRDLETGAIAVTGGPAAVLH